ncbi:MAG: response regulator [Burkholderiales bacterium]|nr:response regulator [Burkholderiales bacterium]
MNIVIVDDNPVNIALLKALVASFDGTVPVTFTDPREGLKWCLEGDPDIIILDYVMPGLDGLEFLRTLRAEPTRADVPVLMITASHENGVRYDALNLGANDFLTKPIDRVELLARSRNMLALRRAQKRLADRASWLGVGMSDAERELLMQAAPMHDIGKVATPDSILLKAGRLTLPEWAVMREHAGIGHAILNGSESPLLRMAAVIAHSHHEKFDGSGYPLGLAGLAIPLPGRIVAVADVFDALTSERPYKAAWPLERARDYLTEQRGSHFDPACVDAFVTQWTEVLEIRERFQDEGREHLIEETPGR